MRPSRIFSTSADVDPANAPPAAVRARLSIPIGRPTAQGQSTYADILGITEEAGADLVVVGSHRPAMKDYLLGTNASRVVRHARCSVLVARE
jgi:nucleotide-binding universal stress UspA family protein